MHPFLNPLLYRLGLQGKPRYTLEETADILGIRRNQVLDLLKRGKILGLRASERRWSGILAEDLDDYLEEMQALSVARRRRSTPAVAVVLTSPVPAPTSLAMDLPKLPVNPVPPANPPIPHSHDPCSKELADETPDSQPPTKYKLGF